MRKQQADPNKPITEQAEDLLRTIEQSDPMVSVEAMDFLRKQIAAAKKKGGNKNKKN